MGIYHKVFIRNFSSIGLVVSEKTVLQSTLDTSNSMGLGKSDQVISRSR